MDGHDAVEILSTLQPAEPHSVMLKVYSALLKTDGFAYPDPAHPKELQEHPVACVLYATDPLPDILSVPILR